MHSSSGESESDKEQAATILLVEDHGPTRDLVASMLKTGGYKVLKARDGSEALTLAASHDEEIDLLLSDVIMPLVGGLRLAEQLGSRHPSLRVLYMSALVWQESLPSGSALLSKPFSRDRLLAKVREALGSP